MYQFSDSESKDSDDGIRFKTDSTRNKTANISPSPSRQPSERERRNDTSSKKRGRRSRSRSSDRRRRHRSRERNRREKERRSESLSLSEEEVDRKRHPLKRKSSKHGRRRSRSRRRESRKEGGDEGDNKRENFQAASDDRGDPPGLSEGQSEALGPALPPHLVHRTGRSGKVRAETHSRSDNGHDDEAAAPSLPRRTESAERANSCPVLPPQQGSSEIITEAPHLTTKPTTDANDVISNNKTEETEELEAPSIGPALPPHLLRNKTSEHSGTTDENTCIGPVLPPPLQKPEIGKEETDEGKEVSCIGPALPPDLRRKLEEQNASEEGEDEEDAYGPLPPGMAASSAAHVALEERALRMKLDALSPAEGKMEGREEWMLELPEVRAAGLGLGPRQFRSRPGPDLSDRSSWTDTPKDKEEKAKGKVKRKVVDLKEESERIRIQERDKQHEEVIKKHKKKKGGKSLLEMHQEELNNKKDKEQDAGVRRPFSREIDLKVNHFDETQKKAIFKKAQLLDDRFSAGHSKFL